MVRLHHRPGTAGVLGKLTRDPAIKAAGVAITLGLDPLWYLGLDPGDADLVEAAMVEASRNRNSRDMALADRTAAQTSSGVAAALKRLLPRRHR